MEKQAEGKKRRVSYCVLAFSTESWAFGLGFLCFFNQVFLVVFISLNFIKFH